MASIKSIAQKFVAWRRHREATRALSQMTDRELNDIGVPRGDIEYAVSHAKAA